MFFATYRDANYYRKVHEPPGARVVPCRRWRWCDASMDDGYWEPGFTVVLG